MPAVGILALNSGHRHILHATIETFAGESVDLTLFTTDENVEGLRKRGLDVGGFDIMTRSESESDYKYLQSVESFATANLDTLYINTVGYSLKRYVSYLGFNPDCRLYARIYNTRTWFDPGIDTNTVYSSFFVNGSHLLRRAILKRFDGVVVEYPPMKEFIESETAYSGDVFVVPILYATEEYETDNESDRVEITVPGNIQSHRRDYDILLDAFSQAETSLSLTLLGRPRGKYGERICSRCQSFQNKGQDITYHTKWISDVEFEKGISQADIVCSPFHKTVSGKLFNPEVYGQTKGSAVIGHSIRHGKPLLVPDWFNLEWDMADYSLTYRDTADLVQTLERIDTGKIDIIDKQQQASKQLMYLAKRYRDNVNKIINR